MTGPFDEVQDAVGDSDLDRRLLALALLVLLVILGAGIGTIALPGSGPDDNEPTPTPVPITPTTETPTPTPDGGPPPTATATATATPTETPSLTEPRRNDHDHGDEFRDDRDDDDDDEDRTETPSPTPTETAPPGGGGPSRVDLTADGSTVLAKTSDLAPGQSGQNAVTFENAGDASGRLLVNDTVVVDHENSLLDPEEAVGDDNATGELSGALRVRLSVTYGDGSTEYLFGTSSDFVTLASLDGADHTSAETLASGERATVTLEWSLPRSTGNEVQSDGVEFDVDFVLRQTA